MTVPRAATKGNASKPVQTTDAKSAMRKQSTHRKEVVREREAHLDAVQTDKVEISTAARALANVVMDDKPSLQLSAQALRALSGGQPDI